ncbi:MAG: aminotransferase class I/II-fold pyridoxal phosphate-dependent enzyme [Bacteroidota bacterium]
MSHTKDTGSKKNSGEIFDLMDSELERRKQAGNYRSLKTNKSKIDFSSNDYLGLAKLSDFKTEINYPKGSTGSRLLSGNHDVHLDFEKYLADFFKAESALLMNSGYSASLSVLSSVPKRNDLILYDELAHACIKDGTRLSFAKHQSFRHNDLDDLKKKLDKHVGGQMFVVVESIYSMDGDESPLVELVELSKKYSFHLILDEAHSTGLYLGGKGLAHELNLQESIFARIYTFGKAIGRHGACVIGSGTLKNHLINFARPFIYTTAMSPFDVFSIQNSFQSLVHKGEKLRRTLKDNIALFRNNLSVMQTRSILLLPSNSPIQPIIISDKKLLSSVSNQLTEHGFDVRPIFSPTVKEGTERLRVVLHAFNTKNEIDRLSESLAQF